MHFSEVLDGQGDPGKHARACTVLTFSVGEANNKSKSTIGAILANDTEVMESHINPDWFSAIATTIRTERNSKMIENLENQGQ